MVIAILNALWMFFIMHGYIYNCKKAKLRILIVYSRKMEVLFQENDIVPITLNFEEFLTKQEIDKINNELYMSLGYQNIDSSLMNGRKSDFFNADLFLNYFKGGVAIKNYSGDKDIDEIYLFSI